MSPTPRPQHWHPREAACQHPSVPWLPFLGPELLRNFGGILRSPSISQLREREKEKRGTEEGESALGAFSCGMAEGALASCTGREVGRANRVQPLTYVCIAKRLLRVHRGAAAGVGPAQQRGQQQEAERQPKAAGRGAHGALGACVRLLWRGLGGRARPSSPGPLPRANFLSSLSRGKAARGGRGAVHPAEKKEAGGRRASAARLGSSAAFYGCVCCGLGPSRRFIALRGSSAPPLGGWRPVQAGRSQQPSSRAAQPSPEPRLLLCPAWHGCGLPAPPGTLRHRATRAAYLTTRWGRTHVAPVPQRPAVRCVSSDGP